MKEKKVSSEKIALQDGDFFKTVPKFEWVDIYICISFSCNDAHTPNTCCLYGIIQWTNVNVYRCDCYILKDILNNWSDEASTSVLNNLFATISKGSRVLIIERVLHTGGPAEEMVSTCLAYSLNRCANLN